MGGQPDIERTMAWRDRIGQGRRTTRCFAEKSRDGMRRQRLWFARDSNSLNLSDLGDLEGRMELRRVSITWERCSAIRRWFMLAKARCHSLAKAC